MFGKNWIKNKKTLKFFGVVKRTRRKMKYVLVPVADEADMMELVSILQQQAQDDTIDGNLYAAERKLYTVRELEKILQKHEKENEYVL